MPVSCCSFMPCIGVIRSLLRACLGVLIWQGCREGYCPRGFKILQGNVFSARNAKDISPPLTPPSPLIFLFFFIPAPTDAIPEAHSHPLSCSRSALHTRHVTSHSITGSHVSNENLRGCLETPNIWQPTVDIFWLLAFTQCS